VSSARGACSIAPGRLLCNEDDELDTRRIVDAEPELNGKLRARVLAAPQLDRDGLIAAVKADPEVQRLLANAVIVKEVVVPGRLVSFVVKA
jgi:leucyl-tRNA synthetase